MTGEHGGGKGEKRAVPSLALFHLIHNPPVVLGAGDFVEGVEAGQDEFDAGGPHGGVAGGAGLEGLVPHGRDALQVLACWRFFTSKSATS